MAGSYRHVVNARNEFRGVELLDGLGDAYQALEEMYYMIQYLTGGDKGIIFEAYREGYFKKNCPPGNDPGTIEQFWDDEDDH